MLLEDEIAVRKARANFLAFCNYVQPLEPWVPNWHHEIKCAVLQRFVQQEIPYLVITEPPRHGKSTVLSQKSPGYIFGRNPNARVIATSYGAKLAQTFNRDVQRVMLSADYKRVFPSVRLNERNGLPEATSYQRNSEMFEIVGSRGYYKCSGIGGTATGLGYTHGVIDDFLKDYKDAMSQTIRDSQWDWFRAVFLTRKAPGACVAATVTRWSHDDIIGRLKKHMEKIGNLRKLTVLDYPAIQDKDPSWYDPRERGQALWEQMFPVENLRETEQMLGTRIFEALYQQNPTALEGDIIKRAWLTDNMYQPAELPERFDLKIISLDATFDNKGDRSDFVVMQCWGKVGQTKYLIDQVRDRMNFTATLEALQVFHKKHNTLVSPMDGVWIEEAANGAAIIATLKRVMTGVVGVPVHGKSKAVRLEAVAPQMQAGQVRIPANATWVGTYIEEFIEFPNGKNDDQVDSTTLALGKMAGTGTTVFDFDYSGTSKQSNWTLEQNDPLDWGLDH